MKSLLFWTGFKEISKSRFFPLLTILLLFPIAINARCGSVDYTMGADGLSNAVYWLVLITMNTMDVLYAGAAVIVVVSALQIYIRMNNGEGEVTKSIMMLVGGCLFMILAPIVMEAIFGFEMYEF
ncbi:MAG: DUF4134 family protein [Prevotella sp.]|nr:DUF4134 family protein [Candidatus Prevotella equi]